MPRAIEPDEGDARPPIAVSMPARNVGRWIGAAIESVLAQEGVDLRLVVVDDASTDDTRSVARGYRDPRLTLSHLDTPRGIGHAHNLVLRDTDEPIVAHVDADDVIAPGALAKLVDALGTDPRVGQAYCDFYPVDEAGHTDPALAAEWAARFAELRRPPIDHRRALVEDGMVVSALRTYRRAVFEAVGPFDETLPWAVDYEMALRVAERFDFVHVPEPLYGRRLHPGGASQRVTAKPLQQWWMRWRLVRRRLRAGRGELYGSGRLITHARLLRGLPVAVRASVGPGAEHAP